MLLAAFADGNFESWDVPKRSRVRTLHPDRTYQSHALSPDGKYLVVVGREGNRMFDLASGKVVAKFSELQRVQSVAYSRDGKLALGGNTIGIWDAVKREKISDIISDGPQIALAFSYDGRHLAAATTRGPAVYDVAKGRLSVQFEQPERPRELFSVAEGEGPVNVFTFTPNGKTLASGRGRVTLWDISKLTNSGFDVIVPEVAIPRLRDSEPQ
jgi:WD40 repeat protein